MKKIIITTLSLVLFLMCLIGCVNDTKHNRALLEFPNVKWNMTPEEVKNALKLTDEQIVYDEQILPTESGFDGWHISATGISVFGNEVYHAQFIFIKYPGYGKYGLENITLYYPEDTDMNAIKENMVKVYGAGENKTVAYYEIQNGQVVAKTRSVMPDNNIKLAHAWISTVKGSEVLTADAQEAVAEVFTREDAYYPASHEVVMEWIDKNPLVQIWLKDGISETEYFTSNMVQFVANHYVWCMQMETE